MKKNTLWVLTLFTGICLLLFACRRDIDNYIHDRDSAPSMTLESAKIWHLQHLQTDGIEKLKPLWEDAWTVKSTSGKTLILVPAPEQHIDNPDITARRFFVFTANGSNVSDGRIVELIGNKYNVNDNFDLLLKNYDRNEITGFNGSILTYDVNYHFVYSTSFSNGKKNNHDARIVTGGLNALKSNKILAGRPGLKVNDYCAPVQPMNHSFPGSSAPEGCVFVWHQDVVTSGGCIISIHNYYLYTYCPNAGTSGTGSGSGSGSGSGGSGGNTGMGGPNTDCMGVVGGTAQLTGCGCIGGTSPTPICDIDPCLQKTSINTKNNLSIISSQNQSIATQAFAPSNTMEYGAVQTVTSINSSTYKNTPVTPGTVAGTYKATFTWNSTGGYTIGDSHAHLHGSAPSPTDVMNMYTYLTHPDVVASGTSGQQFYKQNVSRTVVTPSGNYVVTVKNWSLFQTVYNTYKANPSQFINNYQQIATDHDQNGKGTEYAFLILMGDCLNLYKTPNGSVNYEPLHLDINGNPVIIQCP